MSHTALPILRTPRLTLRPLRQADADAVFDGVGNHDVIRWLGRIPYPYAHSDAVEFIDRVRRDGLAVWAIEDRCGFVGVVGIDDELGYWLARPAWRKGYGFEAARAVVEHWFSNPEVGDLESGHYMDNTRSKRILEALGFEKVGEGLRFARALSQQVPGSDMILTRARWQARQVFRIESKRLVLRPLEPRDAAGVVAIARPDVARNMATVPPAMTLAEAQQFVAKNTFNGVPGLRLAIEMDGRYVGGLGFGGDPLGVAYMLHPAAWGQGIMTEALGAFLPALFDRLPVNRITADHFEDNPTSGALLRKFGFVETGREMGTSLARLEPAPLITYALTREDLKDPT